MMRNVNSIILLGVVMSISLLFSRPVFSHCEIPCGIYDDQMRFDMLEEHFKTIEKSMKQIVELSKAKDKNYNQIVRWVNNKEKHASKVQHIVYQYFMTQRVKPVSEKNGEEYKQYVEKITVLHAMLVYAMKSKQTTDLSCVEELRSLLSRFRTAYLVSEGKWHSH
jgi:nickel superoxide dismutase